MHEIQQILTITAAVQGSGQGFQIVGGYKTHAVSDFLDTGDLESLALLDDLDKAGRLHQAGVGAGIQPGHPTAHFFDEKPVLFKVGFVDVGDFQFAASGGFQLVGNRDHIVVVEIQAGHRPI